MAVEIERKFLLRDDAWRDGAAGTVMRQGYLSTDPQRVVRVRWTVDQAYLTIKGPATGASRAEFEYTIPLAEALELLEMCTGSLIEKTRYRVPFAGLIWEIDEFHGDNQGLIVAECELEREDQPVTLPPWVGIEVTPDRRYANSCLVTHPFAKW